MIRSPMTGSAHAAALLLCFLLPACDLDLTGSLGSGGFGGYGGGSYTFTGLTIEPSWVEHVLDGTDRISFQAFWSEDGGREPISATWSSRDTVLATIDSSGTAEARIPGEVKVVARARNSIALAGLTISIDPDASWSGSMRLASVSAGGAQACGLSDDGMMYCWGGNHGGEIAPVTSASSVFVPLGTRPEPAFVTVSAGSQRSCALTADGNAYCWGSNWSGYLGDGTREPRSTPTRVDTEAPIESLHLGLRHTCALDGEGHAYCWGQNDSGQLGTVDTSNPVVRPSPVKGERVFRDLGAGEDFTCGLTDAGHVYCWGQVPMGGGTLLLEPTLVGDGGAFESIGAGFDYVCAVDSQGAAHCFGAQYLQEFFADTPVPVDGDLEFVPSSLSVSGHDGTACALTPDGEAHCWGKIPSSDREMMSSLVPVPVPGGHRFSSLSVGGGHTCGITVVGDTLCWGVNGSGGLGIGRTGAGSDEPLPVKGQPRD